MGYAGGRITQCAKTGGEAALGITASKVTPAVVGAPPVTPDYRRKVLELRGVSQRVLRRKRTETDGPSGDPVTKSVRHCGWVRYSENVDFVVRGGRPSHEGVVTCGSVWSCPACASSVCTERATELGEALKRAKALGWRAYLVSLTVPHVATDDLRPMFGLVAKAWQRMLGGKAWKLAKRSLGVEGYVRALECTCGRNGWHPHVHAILLTRYELPAELTAAELERLPPEALERVGQMRKRGARGSSAVVQVQNMQRGDLVREPPGVAPGAKHALRGRRDGTWRTAAAALEEGPGPEHDGQELERAILRSKRNASPQSLEGLRLWAWRRWARIVRQAGLSKAPTLENGVHVDASNNASSYLTKMGLAREIALPQIKKGRAQNITHWQLLHRCADGGGRAYDRARWQEWVEGTKRRRQLTWSVGLRDRLLVEAEAVDEPPELERRARVAGAVFDSRLRWRPGVVRDLELAVADANTITIAEILGAPRVGNEWSFHEVTDDVAGLAVPSTERAGVFYRLDPLEPAAVSDYDTRTGEVWSEHSASYFRGVLRKSKRWSPTRGDARREREHRELADRLTPALLTPQTPQDPCAIRDTGPARAVV